LWRLPNIKDAAAQHQVESGVSVQHPQGLSPGHHLASGHRTPIAGMLPHQQYAPMGDIIAT
jgi:hypothetical protein